jgi:hypothetical protein
MRLGEQTRSSTLVRLGLTLLFGTANLFVSVAALGAGNPIGFLCAIPALYLLWVWAVDFVALFRGQFQPAAHYAARPHYGLWLAGCVLPVALWLLWALIRLR